jgi:leucyl aminopeptidase
VIVGADLLRKNFPAIHAVGRAAASSREPRLIDLRWGKAEAPRVTLVGKGVCFDTGGLDLKTSGGMKLMKKDMGGAATVLGLAHAIMAMKLPVSLRVLIPAVENSVSGDAMRPLDILATRKGLTVEVGNTDAEGRLVLCDALAEADTEEPELLIDLATLTGAARVALGASLPALFSTDDGVADAILEAGRRCGDPLWRMPLFDDYRPLLESPIADLNNIANSPYGGAITAALFLKEFVTTSRPWVHIDTMAYNLESRPGRPTGGEALSLVALFTMLEERYLLENAS